MNHRVSIWKALAIELAAFSAIFAASVILAVAGIVLLGDIAKPHASGGEIELRDGTRILASSPEELRRIQEQNKGQIKSAKLQHTSERPTIPVSATLYPFTGLVAIYVLIRNRKRLRAWLALGWCPIAWGLLGGATLWAINLVFSVVFTALGGEPPESIRFWTKIFSESSVLLPFVVILAPFAEELYFRGRMFDAVNDLWGRRTAFLLTAGLFAAIHMELVFMPVIFVFGLLLAEVRRRSGGLVAPMIAHAINNGAAIWALHHGA